MAKEGEIIKPSEYREQAQGYYESYGKWTKDATDRYERDMARNRAQAGDNTDMLDTVNAKRTKDYKATMKDLEGGEHGKFLTSYFNETKKGILGQLQVDVKSEGPFHNIRSERGAYRGAKYANNILDDNTRSIIKERNTVAMNAAASQEQLYQRSRQGIRPDGMTREEFLQKGGAVSADDQMLYDRSQKEQSSLDSLNTQLSGKIKEVTNMTFDDFYSGQFGAVNVGASKEEQAKTRATDAASGRRSAAAQQKGKLNTTDKLQSAGWWG